VDASGNIVAGYWDYIFKFDYKTGAGLMNRLVCGVAGVAGPAVDGMGNFYVRGVAPGGAIKMFDKDGISLGNAWDITTGYCRKIEVSKDGLTIYQPGYSVHYVQKLTRPTELDLFVPDTLLRGFDCESIAWDPATDGKLWVSSGSYTDLPNRYPTETTNYDVAAWYAFDTKTETLSGEKINWNFYKDKSPDERPRGIALSPDGGTAYVATFSAGAVRKYTKSSTPPTIEFRANMSVQIKKGTFAVGDSLFVEGSFNGWANDKSTILTDLDADSVYTKLLTSGVNVGDVVNFKFRNNHNNLSGNDNWESISDNRTLTVAAGANVYSAYWNNEDVYIPKPTKEIQVTLTVNMELEKLAGLFNPNGGLVELRGDLFGWGPGKNMTASPTNIDIYETTQPVTVSVDDKVSFKFWHSNPEAWEQNKLTDNTQDNRYYIITQADYDAASAVIELAFNNGSLDKVLNQDADIKFTCNTNGSPINNAPANTPFENVFIAGANSPLQWPGGGWPTADTSKVIFLFDDGTNGDAVAGDKIFTKVITFTKYSLLKVEYKYGANWGLATNGGANDNENGIGANHYLQMGKLTSRATVVDTFGITHDVTKVEKLENTPLPTAYLLDQNYPNPFNPETSIRFSVPQESFVTVKVFNTLGEEVMTLVNEEKSAGVYNVSFNAKNLTSGIYFYTIKANDFTSTKKMILMK